MSGGSRVPLGKHAPVSDPVAGASVCKWMCCGPQRAPGLRGGGGKGILNLLPAGGRLASGAAWGPGLSCAPS